MAGVLRSACSVSGGVVSVRKVRILIPLADTCCSLLEAVDVDDRQVARHRLRLLPDEPPPRPEIRDRTERAVADGRERLVDRDRDAVGRLVGRLVIDRIPGAGAHRLADDVGVRQVVGPAETRN